MFVSDSSIFTPTTMKVTVTSTEGTDWQIEVSSDYITEKVKAMALGHFYNPVESIKLSAQYKLVLVSQQRALSDECTLQQEGLKDGDELLLLKRRPVPIVPIETPEEKDKMSHGPDVEIIKQATQQLQPKNFDRICEDETPVVDFQRELRKILISLIEASQRILSLNPEAISIFKSAQERMEERSTPFVDPRALKQLTDMGFSEHRATKALQLNRMSPMEAMEWLFEHESDPDIDEPLLETSRSRGPSQEGLSNFAQPSTSSDTSETSLNSQLAQIQTVANILESFKEFKRREFRPNSRALMNLQEMGFKKEEVIDALRVTGNNQEAACDWLLSDRQTNLDKLDKGLDPDGPIYKAIMSSPVVQLGLNNPRTLLAFLHMLENPGSVSHWLNDPDTAPLLSQIFRIYHAEKHALNVRILPLGLPHTSTD